MILCFAAAAQEFVAGDAAVPQRLMLMLRAVHDAFPPRVPRTGCDVSGCAVEEGGEAVVAGPLHPGMYLVTAPAHGQGAVHAVGLWRRIPATGCTLLYRPPTSGQILDGTHLPPDRYWMGPTYLRTDTGWDPLTSGQILDGTHLPPDRYWM